MLEQINRISKPHSPLHSCHSSHEKYKFQLKLLFKFLRRMEEKSVLAGNVPQEFCFSLQLSRKVKFFIVDGCVRVRCKGKFYAALLLSLLLLFVYEVGRTKYEKFFLTRINFNEAVTFALFDWQHLFLFSLFLFKNVIHIIHTAYNITWTV